LEDQERIHLLEDQEDIAGPGLEATLSLHIVAAAN